jgi:hypothetical protein
MRIAFQKKGGVAYFPGLQQKHAVSEDALGPDDLVKLKELVRASRFFDLPATLKSADSLATAADARTYMLEIEDDGRAHQIEWREGAASPELQSLFDRVEGIVRRHRTANA